MTKPRKKEKKIQVWTSVHPDVYLKLELLERRTHFPIYWHLRRAIEEYVKDVKPIEPDSNPTFKINS